MSAPLNVRNSVVNLSPHDLAKVAEIGAKIRTLADQLSAIFPEREHLIQQIIYALLTKEHVLVFGSFGTGKSDLIHTLFDSITGTNNFSIGFSKFMTEGNIIGLPDVKKMKELGTVEYCRDGGILDADFAELDELFDSNPPLLRVLLGILNERQFKRGRQVEMAKLHTAIACTNGRPEEEIKRHPELGAVVDRFLFLSEVNYLKSDESRRRMYQKYLKGEKPSVTITLDELKFLSDIVVSANQITDPYFIEVYEKIMEKVSKSVSMPVSDRRKCKLLELVEANALLFGRYEVAFEDILAVRWGLCLGGNESQHKAFIDAAKPLIEEANKSLKQSIDEVQIKLLTELEKRVPLVPSAAAPQDLVLLSRNLTALQKEISAVKPTLMSVEDRRKKLLSVVDANLQKVMDLIKKG